jgi:hypothetical protein
MNDSYHIHVTSKAPGRVDEVDIHFVALNPDFDIERLCVTDEIRVTGYRINDEPMVRVDQPSALLDEAIGKAVVMLRPFLTGAH